MDLFWWIVRIALWALTGFLASQIMKSSLGLLWNVILGIVGGAVGTWIASLVGIAATNKLGSILISVAGACLVLYLARMILPRFKK